MGKENTGQNIIALPDFSPYVPDKEGVERIAGQVISNREKLLSRADSFGLDYDFLLRQQAEFAVGPFVYPTPLPTTYAGRVDNFVLATNTTDSIADQLRLNGLNARPYTVLSLAMTEVPNSGVEDSIVLPRSKSEKQKIALPNRERGQAYGFSIVERKSIEKTLQVVTDSYSQYADINWELKRGKKGKVIVNSIREDISVAYDIASSSSPSRDEVAYITFANALNEIIAKRALPDSTPNFTCVDTSIYSPFLREGITDINQFLSMLDSCDFFANNPNLIKIVDRDKKTKMLKLQSLQSGDATFECELDDERVRYSDLIADGVSIAPSKELSYFLCFANLVPVVYGSQNNGSGYYVPYTVARQQVMQAGFDPVLYRIQPRISTKYQEMDTIFDFYKQILLPNLT